MRFGMNGAEICLANSLSQWKPLNQGCSLISCIPFVPNLFTGFLWIIWNINLNYSIHKVHWMNWPTIWQFFLLYLNLLREYLVSNLFPIISKVWPFGEHEFISDDSNSIVVNREWVILFTHYLGSHITWRPRSICGIVWLYNTSYTQVCDSQKTFLIHD